MKSARIGGFAVVLAAAAGVGSTAITPNAAQNAEKTSSRVDQLFVSVFRWR
jgi:hypothetical protein